MALLTLGLALAVAGWTPPAAAGQVGLLPTTWAYTDSHRPREAFVDRAVDMPVGARVDSGGSLHRSRFYATFDISRFRGQVIHEATLLAREKSVTDCARPATVELWRTGPITQQTSWRTPPAELARIGQVTTDSAQCPGYLSYDVVPALNAALRRHGRSLTVELRIPRERESDPAFGRFLTYRLALTVSSNHAPVVSDPKLWSGDQRCGTGHRHPAVNNYATFSGKATDADESDDLTGEFAIWPLDHPDQREEFGGSRYGDGTVRADRSLGQYPHGTVLVWTVRAFDGHDRSRWVGPCYVEIDRTPPATAPVVTSAVYREAEPPGSGGPGIPGTFRFDAQGDRDAVAYEYDDGSGVGTIVRPRHPGGPATIRYTPARRGPNGLRVTSVDAAGNRGPATEHRFWVRDTAPGIDVDVAGVGIPSRITMRSSAPDVTSFGFRVDNGRETRVPAVDGTGTAEVTFTRNGQVTVTARSFAGDRVIGVSQETVRVSDEPAVASDDFSFERDGVVGRKGSFTFRPRTTGVVAYLYSFRHDGQEERIAAAPDGTAVLEWTPEEANYYVLHVRSVRADGSMSEVAGYEFSVMDPRPGVYSGDLNDWPRRDGVGVPIDIEFNTRMPDVAEFVYRVNDGSEQAVPAVYGFARITFTPDRAGENTLVVRSRFADGSFSPAMTWPFRIHSGPVVRWVEFPGGSGGQTGEPATFTFRPGLPGVVEYRYTFEGAAEQTVAAGPGGTATVVHTPAFPGYQTLKVVSRDADGTESDERTYQFTVRDPRVSVHGQYDDQVWGGIGVAGYMSFSTQLFGEVVEYRYRINDGPEQSVPASPDGVSTYLQITPDRNGWNTLYVHSLTASGEASPVTEHRFLVGTAPFVTSPQYPSSQWSGGIGVDGTFVFSGGTTGIVEFQYTIDGEPARTVAADAGTATVVYTPTSWGQHTMEVRGRTTDGTLTDSTSYDIRVNP